MKKYAYGVDIGGTTVKIGFLRPQESLSIHGRFLHAQRIQASSSCLILQHPSRKITRSTASRWVTSRA